MANKLRTFIAVELPSRVVRTAEKIQRHLEAAGLPIRWVKPENMHLTLRFLGDIDPARVHPITTAIGNTSETVRPFFLKTRGIGVFPNFRSPRVIWMGIAGEVELFRKMYQQLEDALVSLGIEPDSRSFTGHLTLGRISGRMRTGSLENAISSIGPIESEPFLIDRFFFIKSELRPSGPIYTRLSETMLSDTGEATANIIYRDIDQEVS